MKRFQQSILILLLLVCAAVSAAAATINIAGHTVNTTTTYPGSTCSLRIYSSLAFTAADGTTVMAGVPGTGAFFKSVPCTIASGVITISSSSLPSTTDALDNQTARYTAIFYDSKNVRQDTFLADFALPTSLGTSVTWGQVKVYKAGKEPFKDTSIYIKSQTDAQIALAAGTLNDASDVTKGRVYLNRAPQSSTSPVAVSTSWNRLNSLNLDISEYGDNLNNAVTAIGAVTKVTLQVSRATTVSANLTVTPNIELTFKNGGYLDAGVGTWTLGIQGPVTAPPSKIFYNFTAGQGTISFASNISLRGVYNAWWGADTAANTAAGVAKATLGVAPVFTANVFDPLSGTSGTPSDTNKYVTNADSRLLDATNLADGLVRLTTAPADPAIPIAVGANDPVVATQTGDRICFAAQAAGADVGAKVNTCDALLSVSKGEIHLTGGGNIATQIILSPHHTLRVLSGTYTATVNGAVVLLKDNTAVDCASWSPTLAESTGTTGGTNSPFVIIGDHAGHTASGGTNVNITVRGCHLKGARGDFNSASQTIGLGNCQNCTVESNWLDATRTIGIQYGGSSATGNYAKNSTIKNNMLTSVASQSIAVTNGEAISISGNQIISPGQTGGPGNTPIDLEPNAVADRVRSITVTNNLIDARNSPSGIVINAILVQNGAGTSSYGPVFIEGNEIIGAALSAAGNQIAHGFIYVLAPNTHVKGNYLQRGFNCLNAESASGGSFTNNVLNGCGYTANYSILLENTSGYTVDGNIILIDPIDALVAGQDRTIQELGSSTGNRYSNNTADFFALLGTSKVGSNTTSTGYFSIGNGTLINRLLSTYATMDFDLTAVVSQDLTMTITGVAVGDSVHLGVPAASVTADTVFFAWVSAANTVTVRASRVAGTPNPASGSFRATVMQF
ncbi:MAG: hypothetical protein ACR2HX_06200 [Pyrinomonadaceae bacterium]